MYKIIVKKKVLKLIKKLPKDIQEKLLWLIEDLKHLGPIQINWPNYSKLSNDNFHCHLSYKLVACWSCAEKSIVIEVYYAGSRKKAPY